jgi:hypothetical protein
LANILLPVKQVVTGALLLLVVGGCSTQTSRVTLSSGTPGGYYDRLGREIDSSARASVGMTVENLASQGSQQNLQRLLARQTDFALVQLDVANTAMRQGKVQAIAVLAHEPVHIITLANSPLKTFDQLEGKRIALGSFGSGIHYTASRLFQAAGLSIREDNSSLDDAFQKLKTRLVDAVIYVGNLNASERLRQQFQVKPSLRLIPIQPAIINYLNAQELGSYQPALIQSGTYQPRPAVPVRDLPTLSTATAVVTRPDVNQQQVELLTWSILSKHRKFSQFNPELEGDEVNSQLQRGLLYIHPAAQAVYDEGDPRHAWIRYWENNSDLQAGMFILVTTSGVGLLLRYWHKRRSKKLFVATSKLVDELNKLLPDDPQQAIASIEDLRQEHRFMFIDGKVTTEVYEQVQQKTQLFADQCRALMEQQRRKLIVETLLLLDDWQASLQTNPEEAVQKLSQIKQQYRELLLTDQVDIEAYTELMQLTLISLITLNPKQSAAIASAPNRLDN